MAIDRTSLIQHALRILDAEGAEALTIRRIAEAAGTSTQAIYTGFGGKTGLLALLRDVAWDALDEAGRRHERSASGIARVVEVGLSFGRAARRAPNRYALCVVALGDDGSLGAPSCLRAAITDAVAEGTIRSDGADRALDLCWGALRGGLALAFEGYLRGDARVEAHLRAALAAALAPSWHNPGASSR